MKTPSKVLVEEIIPALIENKYFLVEDVNKYKSNIVAGSIKAEDWLLAVEKALGACRIGGFWQPKGAPWVTKIPINSAPLGVCKVKIAASRNFFNSKRTSPTNS